MISCFPSQPGKGKLLKIFPIHFHSVADSYSGLFTANLENKEEKNHHHFLVIPIHLHER